MLSFLYTDHSTLIRPTEFMTSVIMAFGWEKKPLQKKQLQRTGLDTMEVMNEMSFD